MEQNTTPTSDDHELLLRMAQGHHAAARELWSRLGRPLAAYAAAMLRVPGGDPTHPAALDAVQGVFVRVLETDRHTLSEVENVRAYLTTGVRNSVLNAMRAGARQEALKLRLVRETPSRTDQGEPRLESLQRALDRLPDDARELVLLKHVAQLTLEQIARSLNENRNTIAGRLRSAMEQIRELLEGPSPGHPASRSATSRSVAATTLPSPSRSTEVRP